MSCEKKGEKKEEHFIPCFCRTSFEPLYKKMIFYNLLTYNKRHFYNHSFWNSI